VPWYRGNTDKKVVLDSAATCLSWNKASAPVPKNKLPQPNFVTGIQKVGVSTPLGEDGWSCRQLTSSNRWAQESISSGAPESRSHLRKRTQLRNINTLTFWSSLRRTTIKGPSRPSRGRIWCSQRPSNQHRFWLLAHKPLRQIPRARCRTSGTLSAQST